MNAHISNLEDLAELIGNLTLNEAYELRQLLKQKFNTNEPEAIFIPSMFYNFAPQVSESVLFDVKMVTCGPEKIKAIKAVKNITGMGLTEAKHLVENLPQILKQTTLDQAVEIQKECEAFGAVVKITEA